MNIQSSLRNAFGLAALAFSLTVGSQQVVAQSIDSPQISNLLAKAKYQAARVADTSDMLRAYSSPEIGWPQTWRIAQMTENVNELGKVCQQLNNLKSEGSPWQQQAISQIDPKLRELAAQLTATIDHLNENHSNVYFSPYRDLVVVTDEKASDLSETVSDYVEYDKAQSKAKDLEQKLSSTVSEDDKSTALPAMNTP